MEEIICFCKNISKALIENAILGGANTLIDIQEATGACTGDQCKELNPSGKCCSTEIVAMLKVNSKDQKKNCCCQD